MSMSRNSSTPRVLIPTPIQDNERRRFSMGKNYILSLIACGAIPIMLPTDLDEGAWRAMYREADGVMLTGGDDVDPAAFGEGKHEKTDGVDAVRDRIEFLLSRWAVEDDKPLFAICRGIQAMNVGLGGALIQDLPSQWGDKVHHNGNYDGLKRHEVAHTVCIEPGSRISQIMTSGDVGVNSFHHQAIKRVAGGLIVTSRAPDGIIESVEMPDKRFYIGVQWHPEEMALGRDDADQIRMMRLFASFVDACKPVQD
jgi:putative glutamine amidotransferase